MSPSNIDLALLIAGDERAWRDLMQSHGRLVLAAARRVRLQPADQEEIFQSTWLAAYRSIGTLRDASKLSSWLYSIAHRLSLDLVQRRRPETVTEEWGTAVLDDMQDPSPTAAELTQQLEESTRLRALVSGLDGRCRELLSALFLEDPCPTYDEICRRSGIPIGSIGPTRARCLRKLQKLWLGVSDGEDRLSILHETSGGGSEEGSEES